MGHYDAKRIADPVHGTIALSELEVDVISSRVFQRLRNIKQLGLAHLVFPGADYSRFAHSIGVCHLTGRILESLRTNSNTEISNSEIQLYRIAALLHDVGHYPYSHATEEAVENYYGGQLLKSKVSTVENELTNQELNNPRFFRHEAVGQKVVTQDPELSEVLNKSGIDPEQVCSIFMRVNPPRFANLISSDLDADRIDYLLRTAHHTGLPYGSVDLDYLLSQMRVDSKDRICLTSKALRTAEHLLLCRYFDYQQVNFHKAVAGFELVLKDSIADLLQAQKVNFSANAVLENILNGTWCEFDDSLILYNIRKLYKETENELCKARAQAILERNPPKLLAEVEFIGQRDEPTAKNFRLQKQALKGHIAAWASKFGIEEELWYVWSAPMALTKVGSHVPISAVVDKAEDIDKYEQAIRVLNGVEADSIPIMESRFSLMSILANHALYSLRVYALLPIKAQARREEIQRQIKADLPDFDWK